MTKEEAIAVFECLATEMTAILAGIPKSEAAADQIKRYIDAYDIAISALRIKQKQESECTKCSGIMYRQTDSGKIIPVGQRCGAKITPPCYVPDGDGCAYQIYGDNNDEPIDRCKSCPLCQSDKIRHKQESVHNDPLVLDELRQMRGEPVWCKELECYGIVKMEKVGSWANELFLVGTWHNGDAAVNFEYDIKSRGLTLYRHKPEEGDGMSKPMSEQMQKLAARYEKATGKKFNAKTNAQKIRSMTDEELAKLFEELCYDSMAHRAKYWLHWLQQPAEEEPK